MNKRSVVISVLLVVLIIFALGLFETKKPDERKGEAYCTFADSESNVVELFEKPKKVAVLFSSLAETWQNAGGKIAITVGESVERGFCGDTVELVDSGAGKTIDNELLLSMEPDFVICSADIAAQKETAELLRKAGIPVAEIRLDSFEDYLSCLKAFTAVTGESENYTAYGENVEKEIEKILAETKVQEDTKILFIRSGSSASSAKAKKAEDNFAAKMLEEFGCYNIADNAQILLDSLSVEEILKEDPDHIFISIMGDWESGVSYMKSLLQSEQYSALTAVKEGKVHFLPKELFQYKPCALWADSYSYLADILDNE